MKRVYITLIALFTVGSLLSQVPQKFAYQAVVRNATGQAIANQNVSVKITLLAGSVTGNAVYSEKHNITTSPQGIINLNVGAGTILSGSMLTVPWGNDIFIKLEIDPAGGNAFVEMGTNQLLSVPYALQAGSLAKGAMEVKPTQDHNPEEPIFVVKNSADKVVFAVYESGARVYIDDTGQPKSSRGGFAIGGLADQTKGDKGTKYLTIEPDSVRFNIQQPAKGKSSRGGFAIGGLADQTKEATGDYMTLRPDSIRFAIDESTITKSSRGGFAIGGLADQTKAFNNYFLVNRDSTFISNTLAAEGNVVVIGDILTGGTVGPLPTPPVTDIDGNTYRTVRIGTQTWMAENLRVTKYNDGTPIYSTEFNGPPFFAYNDGNEILNPAEWGYLYALQVIEYTDKNICPVGWRLPNNVDWDILINEIGGSYNAFKLIDNTPGYWWENKSNKTTSGFGAKPGGYFNADAINTQDMFFDGAHFNANFWSQPYFSVEYLSIVSDVYQISGMYQNFFIEPSTNIFYSNPEYYRGNSVRCIKNASAVTP